MYQKCSKYYQLLDYIVYNVLLLTQSFTPYGAQVSRLGTDRSSPSGDAKVR